MLNQSFSLGTMVMHLGVIHCYLVNLPVLNELFSTGAIVMHLVVTNCYWGSILNQSFSNGAMIMHLGPWGNLIGAELIVQ